MVAAACKLSMDIFGPSADVFPTHQISLSAYLMRLIVTLPLKIVYMFKWMMIIMIP